MDPSDRYTSSVDTSWGMIAKEALPCTGHPLLIDLSLTCTTAPSEEKELLSLPLCCFLLVEGEWSVDDHALLLFSL